MALFTDTMTVYNNVGEGQWHRTVIRGVQWISQEVSVTSEKSAKVKKMVRSVTIDFSRNYGNAQYLDPHRFDLLEDKTGYWTLNAETGLDAIVLGRCDKELSEDYRLKHLRTESECATVTSVSDCRNRSFLKNIKVVAE